MWPHWGKSLDSPNNDKSPWWRCPDILSRTEESHWAVQTMTNLLGDDVPIYYTALRKVIGQSKQWQISLVTMSRYIIPHWGKSLGSPNNDKSPWWRCPDILYRTEESHWAVQTMTNLLGDDVSIYYTALRKVIGQSKQWQISLVTMSRYIIPHWEKSLGITKNDKFPWWWCSCCP